MLLLNNIKHCILYIYSIYKGKVNTAIHIILYIIVNANNTMVSCVYVVGISD